MDHKITHLSQLELLNHIEGQRENRFFAVVDAKLKNHIPQWIHYSPDVYWVESPEEKKNVESYIEGTEFFLKRGIQRSDTLFAIGGGAVTDLAGFMAATLKRGVSWIAIPTTLIGMVDAAIGGKVGINTPQGKNQLGAFHLAKEVLISTDFLKTLPKQDINSGKGEILKYCFLSQEIYDFVMSEKFELEKVIIKCADHKKLVVETDFKEQSSRIFLNLGHTLGHGFERDLKIPHGIAVAMGMKYIFDIFDLPKMNELIEELLKRLKIEMDAIKLESYPFFDFNNFWKFVSNDKKRSVDNMNIVLAKGIGEIYLQPTPVLQLKKMIEGHHDFKAKKS